MKILKSSPVGIGFQPEEMVCHAMVRGGVKLQGQVVEFDFANADTATTDNNMDGGEDSGFANVVTVIAVTNTSGTGSTTGGGTLNTTTNRKIYGIIKGPAGATGSANTFVVDDNLAEVAMYGVVKALVFNFAGGSFTNVSVAKGEDLFVVPGANGQASSFACLVTRDIPTVVAGGTTGFVTEAEYPIVGKCLESITDADPAVLANVWFWGGLPFGIFQSVGVTA